MQLGRLSEVADIEQPQRFDSDVNGLLVTLLARIQDDLGAVDPRLVEFRSRICYQDSEQLVGALEVRRQVFALEGFRMQLEDKLVAVPPGVLSQEAESDRDVAKRILISEGLSCPASGYEIQARYLEPFLLARDELPGVVQIAQHVGLGNKLVVDA